LEHCVKKQYGLLRNERVKGAGASGEILERQLLRRDGKCQSFCDDAQSSLLGTVRPRYGARDLLGLSGRIRVVGWPEQA
jgi:hypothetical protein